MRKHNMDLFYAEANSKQRFSIRKLSIGAASVLLGTAFYLGGNVNVTHAAEGVQVEEPKQVETTPADEQQKIQPDSEGTSIVDSKSQEAEKQPSQSAKVASPIADPSNKLTPDQKDTAIVSKDEDSTKNGSETSTTEKINNSKEPELQSFSPATYSKPMTKQALTENKTEKNTNITFIKNGENKNTLEINSGDNLQIQVSTNDYVAGDTLTVKIHPKAEGINISGTYTVTPANDKPLLADVGEVTKNPNEYEFTDKMLGSGTYRQIINIGTNGKFDPTVVHKDGTYDIAIDLYKNGDLLKSNTFTQKVHHKPYVYWQNNNGEYDSLHNIYTMDKQYVSNGQILPNVDYQWRLAAGINPIFNQGTTLTIPVPEHFVLNEAQTKANSPEWFKDYGHLSIKQDGNKIVISFPKINDAQLKELKLSTFDSNTDAPYKHDFYIVGKINQTVSDKTTVSGTDNITITNEYDHDYTGPLQAILLGTNNTIANTPIGDLLSGNITPDKHNKKLHDFYPDQPEWITTREDSDKGIHALNSNVGISSTAAERLNGVDATVIVPDGMNVSSIVNKDTSDANPVFQYEYIDGSKSEQFTKDNIPTAPTGKFIKNIHIHSDNIDPYHKMFNIDLMGILAKQYRGDNNNSDKSQPAKGDKVSNLDQLITKIEVSLPDSKTNSLHAVTQKGSVWSKGQIVLDKNPDETIHLNKTNVTGSQNVKQSGTKNSGHIIIEPYDFQDEVPNNIYYVVLPENALLNDDKPFTNLPKNATVSYLNIDGRNIVKIKLNGGKREDNSHNAFTLNLDNASIITNKTLESGWNVYVTLPDDEKNYQYYSDSSYDFNKIKDSTTLDNDNKNRKVLPMVEGHTNTWILKNGSWNLVTSVVTQTTTESKGNYNSDYAPAGKSDDHGSTNMSFSSTIVNGESSEMKNITTILRVPNTEDGKSEFNFKLKNPVKVINQTDGKEVTDGIQVFYSTDPVYKSKQMSTITKYNWQEGFAANIPDDFSKVTAVAIKIASIPSQYEYRVVLEGVDPTLKEDAGKTAYVANKIWSDSLNPVSIETGKEPKKGDSSLSAKITVFGESHIKVKFHCKTPDGTDKYIDGDDLVLTDNKDPLTKDDLIKKVLGVDSEILKKNGNKINDNPEFRKELINRYPDLSDYAIDFTKPSDPTNPNGGDTAKWGETSKWYFDGNQVTFELTKLENSSPNIALSRDTSFVSKKNDSTLKQPDNEPNFDTDSLDISYDPLTNDYIVYNISNHLAYKEYDTKDDIPNYKLDSADAKLDGPSHADIQKILEDNRSTLFESNNQQGMRVDITKDEKGSYVANIKKDPSLDPGNISIVYHQVAHYDEKLGNVTVHYVDVEDKANAEPSKTDFETTDGKELTDQKQNAAKDLQYGKSYNNTLWDYEKAGYELATTTTPEGAINGTIDSDNKDIYVYLKHKHTPITDTKSVNETINYVDQNDKALPKDVKDTTKRTITFKPTEGSYHDEVSKEDHVTWSPTGDFTKNGEETQFGTESTKVNGYDLDEDATKNDTTNPADTLNSNKNVAAVTVDPTKELTDITRIIHYKKQSSIKINYVDVEGLKKDDFTNGKSVANGTHNISKDGHTGDSVYENSTTPWDYDKDGWEFVESTSHVTSGLKIGDEPQEITVYLKHKHTPITDTKIVNETINYVDQDGNALPKDVKDTTNRTITFKTTDDSYHDEVTKEDHVTWTASGDTDKNSKSTQFGTESTNAKGFDLDEDATKKDSTNPSSILNNDKDVASVPVNEESKDVNLTVHYNQQAETHIHYMDVNGSNKTSDFNKNDGSAINGHDVDHVGHINDSIFSDGKTPWNYLNDGWILAENPSNVDKNMKLTKDTPHDVYVYLKHGTTDIKNPKKIKVTETVHYVDEDGNPVKDEDGNPIIQTNDQNLTLTQTGKYDKAIKQNIPNGWNADKNSFSTLPFKNVPGYDLDKVYHNDQDGNKVEDGNSIKEISYDPSKVNTDETKDQNVDVYVVLKKKAKTIVHYIDVEGVNKDPKNLTPTDGSTIDNEKHNFTVDGHVGDTDVFSNNLWKYNPNEWEFVTQSPEIEEGKLTDKTPSNLYVYLKHKHSAIQTQPMIVTETVHYVDENDNPVKSDDEVTMTLTPEGYHDNVTDKDVITGWKSDLTNSEFPIHSTHVDGYDIDMSKTNPAEISDDHNEVKAVKVTVENNHQPANVEITIHYTKHIDPIIPDGEDNNSNGNSQQTPLSEDSMNLSEDKPQMILPTEKHKNNKTQKKEHSKKSTPHTHKNKLSKTASKTAPVAHERKSNDSKRLGQTASTHAQDLNANGKKNYSNSNMSPLSEDYTRAKKYNIGTNADKRQKLPKTGESQNELGLIGLGIASLATLIGLAGDKKRKN